MLGGLFHHVGFIATNVVAWLGLVMKNCHGDGRANNGLTGGKYAMN